MDRFDSIPFFDWFASLVPNTHDYFEINYVQRGRGIMHVENAGYEIREGEPSCPRKGSR